MWPSIDHGMLSPSGKVSKRFKAKMDEKMRVLLFGINGLEHPKCPEPTPQQKKAQLLQKAADFRHYAACGMKPRVHTKMAEQFEREAAEI